MRLARITAAALIAVAAALGFQPSTVDAYANYRGFGCTAGACGQVHAYSYRTPTYGHLHNGRLCVVVRINRDFGSYVAVSQAGTWRWC